MDRRQTKKGASVTHLAKRAMEILERAGYELNERGQVVGHKSTLKI
jgi:hypothetical protein